MKSKQINGMFERKIPLLYVYLAYFAVIIMCTTCLSSAIQNALAVEGAPSGSYSYVTYRIQNNDNEVQNGVDLTVDGSVLIENGGRLTISNSILTIQSNTNGQQMIQVMAGGELIIENSIIKSKTTTERYRWIVQGSLFVNGSTIQDLYGSGKVGGIEIYSKYPVEIKNTTITNALTSAIYVHEGTPFLDNLTIQNSQYGIYIYTPASSPSNPTAVISVDDTVKRKNEDFSFSGSGSLGTITQYYWDFDDGSIDVTVSPHHTFPAPGVYKVTLTVTNDNGRKNKAQQLIHVLNALPIAVASAYSYTPAKNEIVTFYGDQSYDLDGTIKEYNWIFDGGTPVYGPIVNKGFSTSGSHTAKLTVIDDAGDRATKTLSLTVSTNSCPVSNAGPDQITYVNRATPFDGTGSTDSDGTISQYLWDWGDGTTPSTGSQPSHLYYKYGSYIVRLTVVDNLGAADNDTAVVLVKKPYWPQLKYDEHHQAIGEYNGPEMSTSVSNVNIATSVMPTTFTIDSGPVTDNNIIFLGSGMTFTAFNFSTLSAIWSYTDTTYYFTTTPAISEDIVVVTAITSSASTVFAFDATPAIDNVDEGFDDPGGASYDIIWKYTTSLKTKSSPLIYNNFVYIKGQVGTYESLYCFDINGTTDGIDGTSYNSQYAWDMMSQTGLGFYSQSVHSPALGNGVIVIPTYDDAAGSGVAYNLLTGQQWNFPTNINRGGSLTPSISGDRVAVATKYGYIDIYDLTPWDSIDEGIADSPGMSYDLIYEYYFPNGISTYGSIVLDNDTIYVAGVKSGVGDFYGQYIYCLKITTSIQVQWVNYLGSGSRYTTSDIALAGSTIYIPMYNATTATYQVQAMNKATGSVKFTYSLTGAGLFGPLAVAGGNLLAHSYGKLYKINRATSITGVLNYNAMITNPIIGEVGQVSGVTNTPYLVYFKHPYVSPVVIAEPISTNDADVCHIRITFVSTTYFIMKAEEWLYRNPGTHGSETVSYIVMERGRHFLPGGVLVEAGISSVNNNVKVVSFIGTFPTTPTVLTQSQTIVDSTPITTRAASVTTTSFQTIVQEEQSQQYTGHSYENVAYIAWTPTYGSVNGTTYEVKNTGTSVTHNWYTITFTGTYGTAPLFIGWTQTWNDVEPGGIRYQSLTSSSVQVKFEEETSRYPDITHSAEIMGYLAIASAGDIREEKTVAAYLNPVTTWSAYSYQPDYNGSMFFASSNLQTWRKSGGPTNLITTQGYIRDAVQNWSVARYSDSFISVRLAVNDLINNITGCSSSSYCTNAKRILVNGTKNETSDMADLASYTAGSSNKYVIWAWSDYNNGTTHLANGQYSTAMSDFISSLSKSLTALGCSKPDLTINSDGLTFDNYSPAINQAFHITVTVKNIYLGNASQSKLRLYLGNPEEPGAVQIDTDILIPVKTPGPNNLTYLESYTISPVTYTPTEIGTYYIYAVIDEDNTIEEMNEENNIVRKSFTVTDGSPFPNMNHINLKNNQIGLVIDGTPDKNGYTVTLKNSTITTNSLYDIQIKNNGHLKTIDTLYTKFYVNVLDTASIDKYWTLNLWAKNSDRTDAPSTTIGYTPANGNRVLGTTDSHGFYSTILKECTFTATGPAYSTHHLIEVDPLNQPTVSRSYVLMDGPKTITMYKGGDADFDGMPDSRENLNRGNNMYWMEAEDHYYSPDQIVNDTRAFPLGINGTAIKPSLVYPYQIVNQNSFMTFKAGTYLIYIRAKSNISTTQNVQISVTANEMPITYFKLTSEYRWYEYTGIVLDVDGDIQLSVSQYGTLNGVDINVDKILFQRWKDNSGNVLIVHGQASDPIESDSDQDRAPDGLEIKSSSSWYEAEEFATASGIILDNTGASNSKEVKPSTPWSNFITINIDQSIDTTEPYFLYFRALGTGSTELDIIVDGGYSGPTIYLNSANYQWYQYLIAFNPSLQTHTISFLAGDLWYYDSIRIDVIHLDMKSKTLVTDLRDSQGSIVNNQFSVPDGLGQDVTYYLKIPDDSLVLDASISLTTNLGYRTYNIPDTGATARATDPTIDEDYLIYIFTNPSDSNDPNNNRLKLVELKQDLNANGLPDLFDSNSPAVSYFITPTGLTVQAPSLSGRNVVYNTQNGITVTDILEDDDSDGTPDYKDSSLPDSKVISATGTDPDISNSTVVWTGTDSLIYSYDINKGFSSVTPTQISPSGTFSHPRISGDNVVYNDASQIRLTQISSWSSGYSDPRVIGNSPRTDSLQIGNTKTTQTISGSVSGTNNYPDIYGNFIVWKNYYNSVYSLYLMDLTMNTNSMVSYKLSDDCPSAPRINGDKVIWTKSGANPGVYIFNVAEDSDNDGTPNYLESPIPAGQQIYSGTSYNPDISGDYPVWDIGTDGKISRAYFGIDVGSTSFSYHSADFQLNKSSDATYNTKNLMISINDYVLAHSIGSGFVNVPVTFHTDSSTQITVNIQDILIHSGFATNPLDPDSDQDGLKDGDEIMGFYGIGVIEAEDVLFAKEWRNPFVDTNTARIKDPIFISQTGVTLTSSYNLVNTDGVRNSFITIPWRAPSTGTYTIVTSPNPSVSRVSDVIWFPRVDCLKPNDYLDQPCLPPYNVVSYYPEKLQGYDVTGVGLATDYLAQVINDAVYIEIREAGGQTLTPISEDKNGAIEKVERGYTIGSSEDSDKGMVSIDLSYNGKYEFVKNTNYMITIGIDLGRLEHNQLYPTNQIFDQLGMLRILNLDYFRVERQTLNPLNSDTDYDGLSDGLEATDTGFPLSNDADHDGISDYDEINGIAPNYIHTNTMRRDTDGDGVRDSVELGLASNNPLLVTTKSFGSWTERIARYQTPYDYRWIANYNDDPSKSITNPIKMDTDSDGLPDGWVDGWTYKSSPVTPSSLRSYQDELNLQKVELRYDVTRWMQGGEVDNQLQVYEGEDLDCDGSIDNTAGTWDFKDDSLERTDVGSYREVSPITANTDTDSVPDGYEIWFSTKYEPRHTTGLNPNVPLINPTNNADGTSDLDAINSILLDTTTRINGIPPSSHEMGVLNGQGIPNSIAIAQKMIFQQPGFPNPAIPSAFGDTSVIQQTVAIQVKLEMNLDTDSKVTLEIWDSRMDGFINLKPTDDMKPLAEGIEAVGASNGWYTFDLPNGIFTNANNNIYYLVLRYVPNNQNPIGWYGGTSNPLTWGHYFSYYQQNDGTWRADYPNDILFQIRFLNQPNTGDHATLLEEYIAGTNPKNPNTDYLEVGSADKQGRINDYLLDGVELGWDSGELCGSYPSLYPCAQGGIIFQTNVANGGISGKNYVTDANAWILYDPDGKGIDTSAIWQTTKYKSSTATQDPLTTNAGLDKENVLILTLEDGTEIYQKPDADPTKKTISSTLYIFDGGLNRDNTYKDINGLEHVSVRMITFPIDTSVVYPIDTLAGYYLKDQLNYRNQMIFLSDPNDPDTDHDGIPDGLETFASPSGGDNIIAGSELDKTGWKVNAEQYYSTVYDDGMINARDSDSDNDGLLDSQEKPYFLATGTNTHVNYATPDSDNDGVLDGQEVKPNDNTDGDGASATAYLCYECAAGITPVDSEYLYNFKVPYNTGNNIFDKDSDDDGVSDYAELNPFLLIDNVVNPSQQVVTTQVNYLEDVSSAKGFAIASNRNIYYGSNKDLMVLENYDRFNRPENNIPRLILTDSNTIKDVVVYNSDTLYYLAGNVIYQYSLNSQITLKSTTLNNALALTVDKDGLVYAISGNPARTITKIDFSQQTPQQTTVYTFGANSIYDIAIDQNKNIFVTVTVSGSTDYLYLLASPYTTPIVLTTSSSLSVRLRYLDADAAGGIYYISDDSPNYQMTIKYLPPEYTHSMYKNKFMIVNIKTVKAISGLDVGAQYDLVIYDSDLNEITGYVGSKSSPIKTDSDNDGLADGLTGELQSYSFSINHNGTGSTAITSAWTYPTMADSDGDGLADGKETLTYYIDVHVKDSVGDRTVTVQNINSDPSRRDTDSDGLNDKIERDFSNSLESDTDQDGILDGIEDTNKDGKVEKGETSPAVMDSDNDGLVDGWKDLGTDGQFDTHDAGETDRTRQSGEAVGEDFNFNGRHDTNEPDPTIRDTDGDTINDGTEVTYLTSLNPALTYNHDADNDGKPDVIETDADADGIPDNIENFNGDTTLQASETNPYNGNSDTDTLPDGAEPSPYQDTDGDGSVNARDPDSNGDFTNDNLQSYVLFRTTANQTNNDNVYKYTSGTYIATFKASSINIQTSMPGTLQRYAYDGWRTTLPGGASNITVYYGPTNINGRELKTMDNKVVYWIYYSGNTTNFVYIPYGGGYSIYKETATNVLSPSIYVYWFSNQHSNELVEKRIVIDWRKALSSDIDFDGLDNAKENSLGTSNSDRDSDNDGVMDGMDPNPANPDADGDHLPDGLEMGITQPVPILGPLGGTDTTTTFAWNGKTIKTYIADTDPSTVTDPKKADTDGDGINDGIEELDNVNPPTNLPDGTNFNGKFDGTHETSPVDKDSDDDGLIDGTDEDTNGNGIKDGAETACAWLFDTDGDGLGDGMELGKTLADVTTDTNLSIFVPDADPTTHTDPLMPDSDGDGVPDGWIDGWTYDATKNPVYGKYNTPDGQFQFGEGEDKNLNGKTDATETKSSTNEANYFDSDGDHLLDGWDIVSSSSIGTYANIMCTRDGNGKLCSDPLATGDYRYWGELSYSHHFLDGGTSHPQSGPTDPTSIDSDGDGLVDGNVEINSKPCELCYTHPNVYGELNGVRTYNNVNQGTKYTDPSSTDTDQDGLSDGLEVFGWEVHIIKEKTKMELPEKARIVFSNPTIDKTDQDDINDYGEFLNSSDPNNMDTDGDHISDSDESVGELTQIDGKEPEILKFSDGKQVELNTVYDWYYFVLTGAHIEVKVKVGDNAGVYNVTIKISGQDAKTEYIANSPKEKTVTIAFKIDVLRSLDNGYDVNITVGDVNGNVNCTETHSDGALEGLAKYLIGKWHALVEAVKKFASGFYDWIWNFIQSRFNSMKQGLIDALYPVLGRPIDWFNSQYSNSGLDAVNNPNFFDSFIKPLLSCLTIIFILAIIVMAIDIVVEVFIAISSGGLSETISQFIMAIFFAVVTTTVLTQIMKDNGPAGLNTVFFKVLEFLGFNTNSGRAMDPMTTMGVMLTFDFFSLVLICIGLADSEVGFLAGIVLFVIGALMGFVISAYGVSSPGGVTALLFWAIIQIVLFLFGLYFSGKPQSKLGWALFWGSLAIFFGSLAAAITCFYLL